MHAAEDLLQVLKIAFNENPNYERVEDVNSRLNTSIPIDFQPTHKTMISHLAQLFNEEYMAIPRSLIS